MAVWFIEGFDHYTDDTYGMPGTAGSLVDLLKKWTGYLNLQYSTDYEISPLFARQQPGQGLYLTGVISGGDGLYKQRPAGSQATLIFGAAMAFTVNPTTNPIVTFLDSATEQCSLRGDGGGRLTFQRGSTVLATSVNTVSINTWYYIEIKVTINNTVGQYEVRVNGTSVNWIPQSPANQNTRSTANNYATGIGISSGVCKCKYDDIYMADTTGSNNDFLGPQVVTCLRPAGVGAFTQWTPNYGPNFANVNEIYPDADLTFNADTVAGHIDTFNLVELPMTAGIVTAIQHIVYAKQDAGAQRVITPFQHTGVGDTAGPTNFNLGSSYLMLLDPRDVNPDTAAAYTIAEMNAAEFGYKLVS